MGKMAAANLAGIREIGQIKRRMGGEKIQIALGIGMQGLVGFCRNRQQVMGARLGSDCVTGRGRLPRWRRFGQNHMGIRAADPKGADAGNAGVGGAGRLPLSQGRWNAHGRPFPIDIRIGGMKVEVGWNLTMLEGEHRFNHTGNARGPF